MPIHNSDLTAILSKTADLLEIDGANEFRVRAYREAADSIDGTPRKIAEMVEAGEDLGELRAIGESMANKIEEIVRTGTLRQLDRLTRRVPAELGDLMEIPGLGPKRVRLLHEALGIDDFDSLRAAAADGKVRQLKGLGSKTEKKILRELDKHRDREKRHRRTDMVEIAEAILTHVRKIDGVKEAVVAGSFRRRKETIGDLDILATCKRGTPVTERFVAYDEVTETLSQGKTRCSVRLRSGLQVDLRVVPEVSFGAALHYFTGSKSHNIAMRKIGVQEELKVNEYGVFRDDKRIAGRTEAEVYEQLGLPYIEPELREDRGEIEAAQRDELPKLVSEADIRGDLHAHTKASDGRYTLAEMADAARQRGYEYFAITEHSQRLTVAQGLDEERLRRQIQEIDELNESFDGFRLLKGIEVDILEDGSLDLADEVLAELDLVVCSIHSQFDLSAEKQTERVIRAMDNPHFNILAHPSGRMIGQRESHAMNVGKVLEAAQDRGCYLEVNSQPDRLDLNDVHCRMAKERGVKLAISTDSHSTGSLGFIRYGIDQARRGWLAADDILNTRRWSELKELIKRD